MSLIVFAPEPKKLNSHNSLTIEVEKSRFGGNLFC